MKKEENRDGNFSTPVREIHSSSKWSKVPRINIFSKSRWKNSNPENGTGNGMKNIIFCRSNSSESAEKSSSSLGRFFSSWKIGGKQKVSKVQKFYFLELFLILWKKFCFVLGRSFDSSFSLMECENPSKDT
jgi:hypothetical protein